MTKLALFGGPKAVTLKDMLITGQPSYGEEYPIIGEEEIVSVIEVLKSRRLCSLVGSKVSEFERAFGEYIGTRFAFATNTGTAALQCCTAASGVGYGDEVIVPAFTFIASATCVVYNGGIPVFVDVDERTYNLDPERVKEAITPKTKAVIAVHLYGQPAEMEALREICDDLGIKLIEDAAQAHGALYKNRKTGSIGHISAFSFQESKNMQTGEGGMVTTDDEELALKAGRMRLFGEILVRNKPRDYVSYDLGNNYRMTEIEAAIGLAQLKRLDEMNEFRRENARILTERLSKIDSFSAPYVRHDVKHVYHMYSPVVSKSTDMPNREIIIEALRAEGVPVFAWQQRPLQNQPVFQEILPKKYTDLRTPVTNELCQSVINMYVHPPNGSDLMEQYASAFQKVHENLHELSAKMEKVQIRAPKDWGVPR